jgi:uncharacterized protein
VERGSAIAVLVDAGPLYAYLDADDRYHAECVELLTTHLGPLVVPQLVVTEVAHLAATRLGASAEVRFLQDLASGELASEPVQPPDWVRIVELVWRYRDARLGTADASAVAAAERLGITTVATLDRHHFEMVRPTHTDAFQLLPE